MSNLTADFAVFLRLRAGAGFLIYPQITPCVPSSFMNASRRAHKPKRRPPCPAVAFSRPSPCDGTASVRVPKIASYAVRRGKQNARRDCQRAQGTKWRSLFHVLAGTYIAFHIIGRQISLKKILSRKEQKKTRQMTITMPTIISPISFMAPPIPERDNKIPPPA